MLGVLASKGAGETAYAPATPATEVSVAGASVAVRAAETLSRAGGDELLGTGFTPPVRRLLLDRYPEIGTATERADATTMNHHLVLMPATDSPNCYVRANSFISGDTNIVAAVELTNSVIMDGASVPHERCAGDSVVGPRANVGAGSVVANPRHDGSPVTLTHAGRRVGPGSRTFGAAIGEGSNLGIRTRLNVGPVVGTTASTESGEIVRRDVGGERP